MGHGFLYPVGASCVFITDLDGPEDGPWDLYSVRDLEWDMLEIDLYYALERRFPSLEKKEEWIGHIYYSKMENAHAYIGWYRDDYDVVTIWMVPKPKIVDCEAPGLSYAWCSMVEESFKKVLKELYPDLNVPTGAWTRGPA